MEGPSLSKYQISALAKIAPDLQCLANLISTTEGKARIKECLGAKDGERLIKFVCGETMSWDPVSNARRSEVVGESKMEMI